MNRKKVIDLLIDIAKILSFLSLVMTCTIKIRTLLGVDTKQIKREDSNANKS